MTSGQIPTLLWRDWQLAWGPVVATAVAATLYGIGVRRVAGWPWRRTLSFGAGLACLLVALCSGIDSWDDWLLSDHMVQHLLLLELAPLLLLSGRPSTLLLRAATRAQRPGLARRIRGLRPLTNPWSALAIIWLVTAGTHLPAFYDATLRHPLLHDLEHGLYLVAGLLMWWPVLDEDPLPSHRLNGFARLAYVIAAMTPMTLLGAWLDRDPTLLYAPYGPRAHVLGISAIVDQQQAGAIMWVLGSSLMVAAGLWQAMAAMIEEEHRLQSRERHQDALAARQGGRP